jgi:hypothetical protein
MRRIGIEMAILGAGIAGAGSAVLSPRVFNAGIALPIGSLLLVVSFIVGLTHMPFAREKPWWRKLTVGAELLCSVVALLILFGMISL